MTVTEKASIQPIQAMGYRSHYDNSFKFSAEAGPLLWMESEVLTVSCQIVP